MPNLDKKWENIWFKTGDIVAESDKSILLAIGEVEAVWFNKSCIKVGTFIKVSVNRDWTYKIVNKNPEDKSTKEVKGVELLTICKK